jgi:K(+)-stimulated pyrophosphate-energized sodium pump
MTGAWHLGASTGLAGGGVLGALSALMTLSASTPYHLALATFGPIADGARGASSMIASAAVPEAQRRTSRLDDAGFAASAVSQTFLIVEGSLSAVLAAGALPMLMAKSPSTTSPIDLREPAVLWSGALGLAAVLAYAGSTVRAATRGARGVVQEVDRQLKGFAQEKGRRAVPLDYTPSYKNCVELAASAALRRLIVPVLLGLSLPLALGLGLRLLFRNTGSALPLAALAAFVVVGAAAAMAHSLSMDGTRASLSAARRASRRGREEGGFSAALSGDAMADLLGDAAGPAAQLLIKSAAVVTLLVAPFIGGSP